MFRTDYINNVFVDHRPIFINSITHVNNLEFEEAISKLEESKNIIVALVDDLPEIPDETLNDQYLLKRVVDILLSYSKYWQNIVNNDFSGSWTHLQNCLDYLRLVKKFQSNQDLNFEAFFENQLLELEKLYPYNIFFSTGITVELFECSICGKDIDSFECDHLKGELYRGKMACGIARNITQCDHIAMVNHPKDKRCVVTYENDGPQFNAVRFLSNLISQKKFTPLSFHHLNFKKIRIKNPDVISQGRNDLCACGSDKKFKKCCSDKEFIEKDHMDIIGQHVDIDTIFA